MAKVWTDSDSDNISANAASSWESAVMIDSPEVAQAYAREHGQIMTFLEPLDWTNAWVGSEYWIGSRAADGAGDWRLDSLTPLRPAVALGVLPRHLL